MENVKYLEKWYRILFWLIIPTVIGNIMTNDTVVELIPALQRPGYLVSTLASLLMAAATLKLKEYSPKLAFAGWGSIGLAVFGLAENFLLSHLGIAVVVAVIMVIVSLVVEYHNYYGHSELLVSYSEELSEKWRKLWKWEILSLGATLGSILVTVLIPIVGVIVVRGGAIALAGVMILRWVYLSQTMKFFEEYEIQKKYEEIPPLVGDIPPQVDAMMPAEPAVEAVDAEETETPME